MTKTLLIVTGIIVGSGFCALADEPVVPTVFTSAQAAAGRTAYQSVCFNCHQPTLAGRKGEPGELPPIASLPPGMQADIAAAGGTIPQLQALSSWRGGPGGRLPTLPIASRSPARFLKQADPLLPEDTDENAYLDLTAYILQVNGAQPGAQELTAASAVPIPHITQTHPERPGASRH